MKIKLVDDFKQAYKWFSVNMMVIATAIQGAWMYIPEDLKAQVPHNLVSIITIAILILGVIGRLVKQGQDDAGAS